MYQSTTTTTATATTTTTTPTVTPTPTPTTIITITTKEIYFCLSLIVTAGTNQDNLITPTEFYSK